MAKMDYLLKYFLVIITKGEKIFARKNNFSACISGILCQFLKKTNFAAMVKWFCLKNKVG